MMPLGALQPPPAVVGGPWSPVGQAWLVALYDAAEIGPSDLVGGELARWPDTSGRGNHALETAEASRPDYTASAPLANSGPVVSYSDADLGKRGVLTPQISTSRVYVCAYYQDGIDASFDGFPTLFSADGDQFGAPRLSGNRFKSEFDTFQDGQFADAYRINGGTESEDILPMPLSLLVGDARLSSFTYAFAIGYRRTEDDRMWDGGIRFIAFTDGTENTADRERLEGWIAHEAGIAASLAVGHPYRDAPP